MRIYSPDNVIDKWILEDFINLLNKFQYSDWLELKKVNLEKLFDFI
jgi:hypothetical protein